MTALDRLFDEIRTCRICVEQPKGKPLPHEPNPVAVLSGEARIVICGQAPGTRVHKSGKPFTDPSGDRLREWLGVTPEQFYDAAKFAIVPMGFCFPGLDAKGGDLPPRRECAERWRAEIFSTMPQVELMLLVGQYAQKWHLGAARQGNLTETVAHWRDYVFAGEGLAKFPLPHPSWRNNSWIKKNPWFSSELLPELQKRIQQLI